MHGIGFLMLIMSLAVVAVLTKTRHKTLKQQMSKHALEDGNTLPQGGLKSVNPDLQADLIKKQLEKQMKERMKAMENLGHP